MIIKHKFKKDIDGYTIDFNYGARVDITGDGVYEIEFINNDTNEVIHKSSASKGEYIKPDIRYYINWKINITKNGITKTEYLDLEGKNVVIHLNESSNALGDSVAWIPYIEEFRKKHNCNVYCKTTWGKLFQNSYNDIIFLDNIDDLKTYAGYIISWYTEYNKSVCPTNYFHIPLQKLATDVLGLDFDEIIPKVDMDISDRPIKEKYICLTHNSTANTKHWHYPYINGIKGWQKIVDWLNFLGYKVMVISKEKTNLKNVIDETGDFPIQKRINQIYHSEFFLGVSSGLSWLSWALGKKVVVISGFTKPFFEFTENIIRIHNDEVCNGCFNKYVFDKDDWDWCPEHKSTNRQFECTRSITPEMIANGIIKNGLVEDKYYNFNVKIDVPKINRRDLFFDYLDRENKLTIYYYGRKNINGISIDFINDDTNEILYSMVDIILSNKLTNWTILKKPDTYGLVSERTNKIRIVFYKDKKILETNYYIKK